MDSSGNEDYSDARALIADGNPISRSILVSQLREIGFRSIVQCSRVSDARRQLENAVFDVVLCEHEFDKDAVTGQDLLDDLRRNQLLPLSTVFIMVTTEATYAKVAEAAESALDGYVLKPHTGVGLIERLAWARQRKTSLRGIFQAIERGNFEFAAEMSLKRFQSRGDYWLYAARIGAELMLRLEKYAEAQELFEAVVAAKTFPWAKLGVARSLLGQGETTEAVNTLENLAREEPNFADAYDILGRAHFDLGHYDRALDVFRMACGVTPHSITRLQQFGILAYYTGHPAEAEEHLSAAARVGIDSRVFDSQCLVLLALVRLEAQDRKGIQQCREYAAKLLERRPDHARYRHHQLAVEAIAAIMDRQWDKARQRVAAMARDAGSREFGLEAAANLIGLLSALANRDAPAEDAERLVDQLGMRFSTSRSMGELLVRAAGAHAGYAERLQACAAQVLKLTEHALTKSVRGDPSAAVRELLVQGGETLNAKLVETAHLVLQRHADQMPDAEQLQEQVAAMRERVGSFTLKAGGRGQPGQSVLGEIPAGKVLPVVHPTIE